MQIDKDVNTNNEEESHIIEELPHIVIKNPEFPGGMTGLINFLAENIKYPLEAHKNTIEGSVITSFTVNKDGSISNISIEQSVHPLLDAEAIRVISIMPKWRPGLQRGKPVNVSFTLPIVFSISNKNADKEVEVADSENVEDEVFVLVDKEPEFPGGKNALLRYLGENTHSPIDHGLQGRPIVNFIIHKDGSISDIKIERGVEPSLDAEAIKIIARMPNWIPGENKGKAVNVRYTLPIVFRLQH